MDAREKMLLAIEKDYERKVKSFSNIEPPKDFVVVGDSMVAYLNPSLYGLNHVCFLGIAGDTTKGVKRRLDLIYRLKPKKVILSIGSNDLVILKSTPKETALEILSIVEDIKKHIETDVYVFSMTPVLNDHEISNPLYISNRTNDMLEEINLILSQSLKHHQFIDIYHDLLGKDMQLDPFLSTDGIHLNKRGYQIYTNYIKDILLK